MGMEWEVGSDAVLGWEVAGNVSLSEVRSALLHSVALIDRRCRKRGKILQGKYIRSWTD